MQSLGEGEEGMEVCGLTSIPSSVDAFAGVLEVKLHALVDEAAVAGHDDSPALAAGGHAGHIEALLPLLIDPLEGEAVRNLQAAMA